jgi:hypothetical protein
MIVMTLYLNENKNVLNQNFFGCSLLHVFSETPDGNIFKTVYVFQFGDELSLWLIAKYFCLKKY